MKTIKALLTAVAVAAALVTGPADATFLSEPTKHPAKVTVPD